jgi:hypothetical protein
MHRSFGMNSKPRSMKWEDVMRGPTLAEVGTHIRKITHYQKLVRRPERSR